MFLRRLVSSVLRSEPATACASPPHNFNPEAIQDSLNTRTTYGKNLPVYVDYRHGGSKIITVIRRIHGDLECLAADLRSELPAGTEFKVRPEMQQVIITGQHVQRIRDFLTYKGF